MEKEEFRFHPALALLLILLLSADLWLAIFRVVSWAL